MCRLYLTLLSGKIVSIGVFKIYLGYTLNIVEILINKSIEGKNMSKQKKLSSLIGQDNDKKLKGEILDLEKKYQSLLWDLFTSKKFIDDLIKIENEIKNNYDFLAKSYKLKNKIQVPAERLTRYYIYNASLNNNLNIQSIYSSPVSGDIAFLTDDAVINIDIKTIDINGNKNDIKYLQYLPNQSSFNHKRIDVHPDYSNSGITIPGLLTSNYNGKPVLTYFLKIIYEDDSKKNSFTISRDKNYGTIHLINLPNGFVSDLFDYDLIDNFKTYKYFNEKDGFPRKLLLEKATLSAANDKIIEKYTNNKDFIIYDVGTKKALLDLKNPHPIFENTLITWVPVSRGNKKLNDFYLEAIKSGDTYRISEEKLRERFDSKDTEWEGVKIYKL